MNKQIEDGSVCPFRLGTARGSLDLSSCITTKCKLWRDDDCTLAGPKAVSPYACPNCGSGRVSSAPATVGGVPCQEYKCADCKWGWSEAAQKAKPGSPAHGPGGKFLKRE